MLELRRGLLYNIKKYWSLFVISLALTSGFGFLLHTTINGTLLADDRFVMNHGEQSERVAALSIPSIEVKAMVFGVGVDEDNRIEAPRVRSNVGWFQEGEEKGLARFLVGHSPGVFDGLRYLEEGEVVTFHKDGWIENYEVVGISVKYRDDINMTNELLGADLVLMTCFGERVGDDYVQRLIIYAKKL
ncbi:class F sortase [Candidatus Saccharibacteria bacterium]|nr:class F sortase [Candidatus Saccharibacteria bacterium]